MKKIILLVVLMVSAFTSKQVHAQNTDPEPIAHAVMFWMDGSKGTEFWPHFNCGVISLCNIILLILSVVDIP